MTISVEKYRHKVETLLKVNGIMIQAEAITEEVYSSIDEVAGKLERQIKKYKEKLVSHRKAEGKPGTETLDGNEQKRLPRQWRNAGQAAVSGPCSARRMTPLCQARLQ